jgi:serine/threonine-protein kinase
VSIKKLGRYDLIRVLGKGAMGIVYEGRDPNLDRRVAIKTVKVENMSEEAAAEYEARFRTEARSAARLQHPNIVSVYDSDRDGDIAFLVMEFIQGDDLKHHIDKGERFTLDQSLKMIRDLLAALDYAHKQGIVHRDIKPANLLIEPGGRIKLTDFGVARIQDSGEATRTQGAMVGTLKYMSPEQVQGQPVDSRADLFSVGIVLYQLLTDKRPFDGENDFSIIHQIIGHSPTPPSAINPQLPDAIDAVVARALAKKREERFATAKDFAVALQAAIRRASDQTVVPPANPGRQSSGADTRGSGVTQGSATSGTAATSATSATGATSTNTSTVTQELELVYWKDIKDSTEPEEIEGFLAKFPTGIYADLARRRLRKLASGAGDATMGSYGTSPSLAQDTDATRMRSDPPRMPASDASQSGIRRADETRTLVQPREVTDGSTAPVSGPAAAPDTTPAVDPRDAPTIPPIPKKMAAVAPQEPVDQNAAGAARAEAADAAQPPAAGAGPSPAAGAAGKSSAVKFAVAGVVLAAVAAVALKFTMGGGEAPAAAGAASAASVPLASPNPAASTALGTAATASAAVAASSAASSVRPAASAASAALAGASAPRLSASQIAARARPKASAASAPAVATSPAPAPAAPLPAPVTPRADSRPASAAAPAHASGSPADGCEGRMLIGYQICMSEQCAKPAFQNHPICVERREMERRRREQQQRIN